MNKRKIIEETEKFFKENIPKSRPKNIYIRHLKGVKKYSLRLADIYNSDKFIVEISALLHDIGQMQEKNTQTKVLKFLRNF